MVIVSVFVEAQVEAGSLTGKETVIEKGVEIEKSEGTLIWKFSNI